jgi:hypothetical protein
MFSLSEIVLAASTKRPQRNTVPNGLSPHQLQAKRCPWLSGPRVQPLKWLHQTGCLLRAAGLGWALASSPATAQDFAALWNQLQQRDAKIQELERRLNHLEQQRVMPEHSMPAVINTPAPTAATVPTERATVVEVDGLTAERALERSLTQSGALLLPKGQAEVQFNINLARQQRSQPVLVAQQGQAGLLNLNSWRLDIGMGLTARVGLPGEMQLEIDLPYRRVQSAEVLDLRTVPGNGPVLAQRDTRKGVGDINVGVARTLMRETGPWPDVIGRLSLNLGQGEPALGEGHRKVRVGLTALKRQDPLVFVGQMHYERTQRQGELQPGAQWGVSLATLLAVSPYTSLSLGLDQTFTQRSRMNGQTLVGTSQVSSMLVLGTTTALSRNTVLSITAGIGLTPAAPDYFVGVTVPIQFELWK